MHTLVLFFASSLFTSFISHTTASEFCLNVSPLLPIPYFLHTHFAATVEVATSYYMGIFDLVVSGGVQWLRTFTSNIYLSFCFAFAELNYGYLFAYGILASSSSVLTEQKHV